MNRIKDLFSDISTRKHLKEIFKEIGAILGIIIICSVLIFILNQNPPDRIYIQIIIAGLVIIIGIVTLVSYKLKKRLDSETGSPAEDEFTLSLKRHAGDKAFHLSMYFWVVLFILNYRISFKDTDGLLGGAILGSALIYGACLWYYKSTGNFNEE